MKSIKSILTCIRVTLNMLNTIPHNFNRPILSYIRVTLNMLNTTPHNFNRPILTCIRVTLKMGGKLVEKLLKIGKTSQKTNKNR